MIFQVLDLEVLRQGGHQEQPLQHLLGPQTQQHIGRTETQLALGMPHQQNRLTAMIVAVNVALLSCHCQYRTSPVKIGCNAASEGVNRMWYSNGGNTKLSWRPLLL